jgi:CheY-like chemotaxis protein
MCLAPSKLILTLTMVRILRSKLDQYDLACSFKVVRKSLSLSFPLYHTRQRSHLSVAAGREMVKVSMIRLVLVDDQATVRQGLRMRLLLEPDIIVVGEASSGKEALALVQQLYPDVVLMDVEMPDMDGITATTALCNIVPHCVTVILSIHSDNVTRARAKTAGAKAFVEKLGSTKVLVTVIRQACQKSS